ncbi:hypothetical protein EMPS_02778 [Entomortierella parvispora]|uniref:Peptidase A1 domain-containing protein n=1 Tax=Entomortierella parvispora TaxID=205924 RepID=A0A9P3H5K1_9FUNG|nr:hypothetical protein EMPS_02778 [Entomortierella parvispora]
MHNHPRPLAALILTRAWYVQSIFHRPAFAFIVKPELREKQFTTEISLGTPGQLFKVQLSTGTSNFWAPSAQCSTPTCSLHPRFDASLSSTFQTNGTKFKIPLLTRGVFQEDSLLHYSDNNSGDEGNFLNGQLGNDKLMFAGGLIEIPNQSFGQVLGEQTKSGEGMKRVLANDQFDGILGLGYQPEGRLTGRPFLLNLVDQGLLDEPVFGIYLSKNRSDNGEEDDDTIGNQLTLGGLDPSHYSDEGIEWHEVTRVAQGQRVIELTAFALRREAFEIDGNAIIDSGFPYIALTRYQAEMINIQIGAQETAPASGHYELPCKNVPELFDFIIMFGQESYVLHGNEYVRRGEEGQLPSSPSPWSRHGKKKRSGAAVCQSMIIGMDFPKETGIIAIFGEVFLQKFYSAYDLDKGQVGFALAT